MTLTPKQKAAFDLLKEGPEYQGYFFNRVEDVGLFMPLKEEGFFNPSNNPTPIESAERKGSFTIPFWSVLIYLEKVSKVSDKPEHRKYAEALIGILREVTKPENDPDKRSDNYRTWYIFSKIMGNLPTDTIKLEDIDLIKYWLDSKFDSGLVGREIGQSLLPKLIEKSDNEDIQKAVRIIDIIVRSKGHGKGVMDAHDLEELFKKNAVNLGHQCGKEVVSILRSRLESEQIIPEKDDAYSYIWRPAIEEHAQNTSREDAREALISGLRDVLSAYAQAKDASESLLELFKSPRWIIKRIVLHVLNVQFQKYSELGQKLIMENLTDLFSKSNYHHEFFELLRSRFKDFAEDNQQKIIETISGLAHQWPDNVPSNEREGLNKGIRLRWFLAIYGSGYSFPQNVIKEYGLDSAKMDHPEFLSYHGPVTWGTEQLFSVGDLMAKGGIKDIVKFLNEFEGKNRFNEVGYEEAGQVLKQAIKTNQQLFENNLNEFLDAKPVYQYYALQAFEELWNEKKLIDWQKVLEFIKQIVDSEKLWAKETEKRTIGFYFRKDWIPSLIARLIQSGIRDDEWLMPDARLPEARNILEVLLEKIDPSAKETEADALTEAINSSKGHAIEAYFNYALRECRILSAKHENQGIEERKKFWEGIKPIFNKELDKAKNANFEFSALAGQYLPNLYYLSKEWVKENINKIFPVDPELDKNWRCAISGYSYVNMVYTVIYRLLKDNGHFKRVLNSSFDKSNIRERVIENIAISYLRGEEDLQSKNSLMAYILDVWQSQDICSVIDLFWSHREVDFKNGEDQRILAFWEYCYSKIKDNEQAHRTILSDLNLLATFLKKIDSKSKDWLIQSAPYVEERHHAYFFLESLDRLADTNPKEVGEVYLAMLEGNALPLYEESNIKSIVEKIYKEKEKSLANKICDRYSREGHEFLNDLYEKYNR